MVRRWPQICLAYRGRQRRRRQRKVQRYPPADARPFPARPSPSSSPEPSRKIWPSDWTCLRRKNTPARRLGCGLRRRGICQRSLLCESERFQSTFRNGRRRAHRPPLHGDRLSGRRRHVYRKQRAGQLYADSADRGLHHRSGRLRGVFPQPFREVMRPRT